MKAAEDLFDTETHQEMRRRILALTPESPRQWGKMSSAQMLTHCARGVQMATGELKVPRVFIGRILGPIIKPMALKEGEPMRRNSPTVPALLVTESCEFESERQRLVAELDGFAAAGPGGCSTHPHPFFGSLTPAQWSTLVHKHLDHHLRQFSA
jgi:hypothetical protein